MISPLTVLKSVGPKLVPFFKTCTIFFVLFADTPASETSAPWFFCIVKCLPIISLILFVLLNGMSITEYYRYSRRVLIGLIFSCLGDACLVWAKSYFEVGIGCFAIAQICYARAFGWKPFNPYAGTFIFGLGALFYAFLSPALHGIMVYMVALYVMVICTMAWRAVARVQFFGDLYIKWTKLSGCFGALAFVISDVTLAVDRFRFHIPYAHPIIMMTYYAAQLGIALSVVDSQVDELIDASKRNANSESTQTSTQENGHSRQPSDSSIQANGFVTMPGLASCDMLIHRSLEEREAVN
ncbi:lysoplasmalogenase-like protein TMEM86A [Mya arenaria]|uniref:lysoplasmalogenase-like protein TMEM86A n=1 Tax=Mya arenaria TaxID=6604 RepID=UPI0022E8926D|nr:lysoplasmalogenase-like protein TMEM86A [Mya arenaria]XP_052800757.1 lysoplasmalogenase-like protein TMEM86A [Mya arenaria]